MKSDLIVNIMSSKPQSQLRALSPGGSYAAEAPPVGGRGQAVRSPYSSPHGGSPSSSSVHSSMREVLGGGGGGGNVPLQPSHSLSGLISYKDSLSAHLHGFIRCD